MLAQLKRRGLSALIFSLLVLAAGIGLAALTSDWPGQVRAAAAFQGGGQYVVQAAPRQGTPTPTPTTWCPPSPGCLVTSTPTGTRTPTRTPTLTRTPTATPTCPPSWQVVPSLNVGSDSNYLTGIAAINPDDVWVTGYYTGTGRYLTLAEHWNGSQWSIVPSPNPGPSHNVINGIAAISSNDIWAVGWYNYTWYPYGRHPMTLHWNGISWSNVYNGDPGGNYESYLQGVTAFASNDVWAVGFYRENFPSDLAMHWDGTAWSVTGPPLGAEEFNSVAGAASNDVWAVGSNGWYPGGSSVAAHWNGSAWSSMAVPDIGILWGVDAVSTNDVWAVGAGGILHWNGTAWTVNTTAFSGLNAVAAISANDVWAVNGAGGFIHWDGTSWNQVQGGVPSTLRGISAISSTDIWAAGYQPAGGGYRTLVERYGPLCGTPTATPTSTNTATPTSTPPCPPAWSEVASLNVGTGDNYLTGVAAISATDIWATGYYTGTGRYLTLAEHWDGSQWTIFTTPNPGAYNNVLNGITAISTDDVWAVGWFNNDPVHPTRHLITMHWNGTAWSEIPNPDPGGNYDNYLMGAFAFASNDVWAVGFYRYTGPHGLLLRWDGTQWTQPDFGPGYEQFNAVSGTAPNDLWAVGSDSFNPPGNSVVAHWDGSTLTNVTAPDISTLWGVAAVTATDAWAVGDSGVIHWNGSVWSVATTAYTGLRAVTAISANDIWAVGLGGLIVHWDGTSWSQVSNPVPGNLDAIWAISGSEIWAAGDQFVGGFHRTLVERYLSACGTATPTSTPQTSATSTPTDTPAPGSPTATGTPCTITFTDVQPSDYFYEAVSYLYCHGVISGYADNTFRPYNNTTRGQMTKIIVLAEGWQVVCPPTPTFTDVPPTDPFYCYVETAVQHGIVSGYADRTFRPYNNVTRGQLSKIVVLAEAWQIDTSGGPHFSDVPTTNPFYQYVETAYHHGIISGYADGTFRPGNPATRGQISKIVYLAITGP